MKGPSLPSGPELVPLGESLTLGLPWSILEGELHAFFARPFVHVPIRGLPQELCLKITIATPHNSYPERVREAGLAQLESLGAVGGEVHSLTATLIQQKNEHRAEIVAEANHHQTLVADAAGLTIEAALTTAVDRMRSQLRKLHDKVVDRRHGKA
ncbi:MAG TPA: HPF/RaiA family ribosome-associated protein [Planctomycetes bacterium]|nr:HPF/RaiA family ribosome-associated protein [Planctomycetota bacterium]HIL37550.1 HPF/RaiA family ribosome-associated protein [Planctomycetota bacterium]